MNLYEPFSTHHEWDALTHEAYAAMPVNHHGWHYQLHDKSTQHELAAWREWAKKYPNHHPGWLREFIAQRKRKQQQQAA